ncbi:MAG TPA: 50S ribosomal protein L29 [Acidobacteriota bacterium]
MKIREIRELGDEELKVRLEELADQLFKQRFQLAAGQAESVQSIRRLRVSVARIKTVLRERELQIKREAAEA